jgi:hypothetical protein
MEVVNDFQKTNLKKNEETFSKTTLSIRLTFSNKIILGSLKK